MAAAEIRRIATMALAVDNLSFAAYGDIPTKISAKAGHEVALIDAAQLAPSSVMRPSERQERGFSYIRP